MAHRRAGIKASHTIGEFGHDETTFIDVFYALERTGLAVMLQPMPHLFGVYHPPRPDVGGVLLNAGLDEIALRHSASHELGHHLFGHDLCLDADEDSDPMQDWGTRGWPNEEKLAEAFAAWYLMPIAAVKATLRTLGISRATTSDEAYQVSLHLGTHYVSTVRHLAAINLADSAAVRTWSRVPPSTLRRRALPLPVGEPPSRAQVWTLGPAADGAVLHVRRGDRLVVQGAAALAVRDPERMPTGVEIQGVADTDEPWTVLRITDSLMADAGPKPAVATSAVLGCPGWTVTVIPFLRRPPGLLFPR